MPQQYERRLRPWFSARKNRGSYRLSRSARQSFIFYHACSFFVLFVAKGVNFHTLRSMYLIHFGFHLVFFFFSFSSTSFAAPYIVDSLFLYFVFVSFNGSLCHFLILSFYHFPFNFFFLLMDFLLCHYFQRFKKYSSFNSLFSFFQFLFILFPSSFLISFYSFLSSNIFFLFFSFRLF